MKLSDRELRDALLLYGVTDRAWLQGRTLEECVEQAIVGGTTCIQLREKEATHEEFLQLAVGVKKICAAHEVPLLINDNLDLALEVKADGVHVGQDDVSCAQARSLLGPDAIVGVSAQTVAEALKAEQEGADYLGVGALIATPTKPDAVFVSADELRAICRAVKIPVIGIGGLNEGTIPRFTGTGLVGAAVVSALFDAPNITERAQTLYRIVMQAFRQSKD